MEQRETIVIFHLIDWNIEESASDPRQCNAGEKDA